MQFNLNVPFEREQEKQWCASAKVCPARKDVDKLIPTVVGAKENTGRFEFPRSLVKRRGIFREAFPALLASPGKFNIDVRASKSQSKNGGETGG